LIVWKSGNLPTSAVAFGAQGKGLGSCKQDAVFGQKWII